MREGSDQIAVLHGEGFCKPRGIRPSVPSGVTMDGCFHQCRSKLPEALKKAREELCISKQSLHTSPQTATTFCYSRHSEETTFKRKRPYTKISDAFKIAEIYSSSAI